MLSKLVSISAIALVSSTAMADLYFCKVQDGVRTYDIKIVARQGIDAVSKPVSVTNFGGHEGDRTIFDGKVGFAGNDAPGVRVYLNGTVGRKKIDWKLPKYRDKCFVFNGQTHSISLEGRNTAKLKGDYAVYPILETDPRKMCDLPQLAPPMPHKLSCVRQ